jgi:hypothetical protein
MVRALAKAPVMVRALVMVRTAGSVKWEEVTSTFASV